MALSSFRQVNGPSRERFLWINALSIDQTNIAEQNLQVRLMTKIYDKAANVLIWIGTPTEESELATARMKAMESVVFVMWRQ